MDSKAGILALIKDSEGLVKPLVSPQMKFIEDEWDPLYGEILNNLRASRKDLVFGAGNKTRNHTCSNRECEPQNNGTNVYLCKYGVVHLCSASRCEYYGHTQSKTCPISGIVMEHSVVAQNTYDKNDSRTWKQESEIVGALSESRLGPEKKKKHSAAKQILRNNAENVVVNLLYSSNRERRNKVAYDAMDERAGKARQTYVNGRFKKRQLPYASDMCRVTAVVFAEKLPYVIYSYDEMMIRYYVEIVIQVWSLVQKYAVPHKEKVYDMDDKEVVPRIDFESIALATLYAMREGMDYEGAIALPRDVFLFENLPQLNDLDSYFGVSQNKITKGTTILLMVYNNAKNDGATVEEVCLNPALLPDKDAESGFKKLGN
jgi:hypothetical protein